MKRNTWKRAVSMFAAAGLAASLLAGCGGSSSQDQPAAAVKGTKDVDPEGTAAVKNVAFAISSDNGDLSPFGGDSGGRHHTYRMLYDCLCASYGLGQSVEDLQGQIAKSWTVVDSRTVDVELYDYVKDSQGNEIKASDVVYSYEQAIASGTMEKLNGYLDEVKATGNYTLRITLTGSSKGAMEWCLTTVPIVSEAWFSKASDADKTNNPAVTGAYILAENVSGAHTTLKKNEDYWQTDESLRSYYDTQTFDTITINVQKESSMRVIALENGEVDISQNILSSDIAAFMNEDGTPVDGWNVYPDENGRMNVMMFNNDNSVFADNKELRQAVLYAIDFEGVRLGYGNAAFNGSVCHDFSPDVASDYIDSWKEEDYYDYNVEKAKELLAAAGHPDGGFPVKLMYQNSTTATAGLTVLQSYLAEVGIDCELMPVDQALFNSYKYDNTKWDIIVDSKATSDYVTSVWENVFDTRAFQNGSACFTHDDKLQTLLETAANTETTSEAALQEFHDYLKDQAYAVGMFWNYSYYVAQDGITEIPQDGFGNVTASTLGIAEDYVSVTDR
ncbi:ABC transporter substrate-binding protein [Clostridium sp. AN503]|uniref:ABC transporter substrate-binding protein n=1 Tax=Clostridium sp. AN503 TaxID=3160598 RepID=UPI003458D99C